MSKINIIVCGRHHTFREPVISLEESLREIGHDVYTSWFVNNGDTVRLGENNIYIGALLTRNVPILPDKLNIYFCTEQYLANRVAAHKEYYINEIDKYTVVIDMFKKMVVMPKKAKHIYCPIGWSPIWDENYNPSIKETINLFLMGNLQFTNTRRKGIRERVTRKICYGPERDSFIQQAKINLSLQTYSTGYEWTPYRMLYVLGKRKFLMADEHIDYGPYEPGKHFIVFKGDDISESYNEWVNDNKKRQEFAMNAYEDIKKNHKFSLYLENSLKGIL